MLPDTSLIVLSASPSSDYEDLAREAGADAYVEKSAGAAQIAKVLREFLADEGGDDENAPTIPDKLSKRQRQLLVMLDRGLVEPGPSPSSSASANTRSRCTCGAFSAA